MKPQQRVRTHVALVSLLAVAMVAWAVPHAGAQVLYGTIVGNVRDTTGGSLPGVVVVATHQQTNLTRETVTNEVGAYTFNNLPAGPYTVRASLPGFREAVTTDVPVTVNFVSRMDLTLQVGAIEETVMVVSEAALLQTDRADIHTEFRSEQIEAAPLANYRNYQSLLNLVPGATPTGFQNAVIDTPARSLTTNVNGTPRNNNNTRQDGAANVNIWLPHHAAYVASAESIDTVNITTNSFDAEQGMAGGAAITVITKSGTNQLRGSAYAFHDNNKLKSNNFFAPPDFKQPDGSRNIDGGTIGGPIQRDKLFFFGSYDGTFERVGRIANVTVPLDPWRQGDFSGVSTIIYDPLTGNPDGTGRQPFQNNQIPANRLSPIAQQILGFVPLPNQAGDTQNHFSSANQIFDRHQFDAKINWNRNASHQIWGKYGRMDAAVECEFGFPSPGGGPTLCDVGAGRGDTLTQIGNVGHTWTLRPNLVMDGTFGVTNMGQEVTAPDFGQNFGLDVLGIPGTNHGNVGLPNADRYSGMPSFAISGFQTIGNHLGWTPIFRTERSYTANTNFSWISGPHDIRFGVDVVRHQLDHWQPELGAGPRGHFIFNGGGTVLRGGPAPNFHNAFAQFLLGNVNTMQRSIQWEEMTAREWQYAFYVRDRWQVGERLTLNLGLRIERYPLMQRADRGIEVWDPQTNIVRFGGVGGNPDDLGLKVKYPWAVPRLGLAYRMTDNDVFRVGYGRTIDPMPFARPLRGFFPLTIGRDFVGIDDFQPFGRLEDGIPAFTGPDINAGQSDLPATALMRTPRPDEVNRGYIDSWNVMYERKLAFDIVTSVGYVGTATRKILGDININAAGPGEGQPGQPLFPLHGRTASSLLWDGQFKADYHSLQIAVNRPFRGGVLLKGAYTLSRAKTEMAGTGDTGWAGVDFNHPSVQHRNYQLAGYDRPHIFQLGWVADLPFGRDGQGGAMSPIIRNWQVNGSLSAYSGTPFTVTAPGASLNAPGNLQTADLVGTATRTGGVQRNEPFYNPDAWLAVTEARFGTSERNSVRGPGAKNINLGVVRRFAVGDRANIEGRMEVFNLFNWAHFNNPVNSVVATNFMQITSSQIVADRQIRFGLRFAF